MAEATLNELMDAYAVAESILADAQSTLDAARDTEREAKNALRNRMAREGLDYVEWAGNAYFLEGYFFKKKPLGLSDGSPGPG